MGTFQLGTVGLVLMLLIAKLAYSVDASPPTHLRRAKAFLARRAIDGIATVGWLVDRLFVPEMRSGMVTGISSQA